MLALWLQSSKSFRDMLGIHCRKAVPLSSVPLRMHSEISRYFNTVYYIGFIQYNILLQVTVTATSLARNFTDLLSIYYAARKSMLTEENI